MSDLYFGMVGPVSRRKRLDLLLAAFRITNQQLPNSRLLIAGTLDDQAHLLLKQNRDLILKDRLIVLDRYFETSQIELLFPALDVVVVPYEGHLGSSGIVLRAAAARRPVVASNINWLKRTINYFGLGETCSIQDAHEFSENMVNAMQSAADFRLSPSALRYLEFQSSENFRATWLSTLRSRLGMPADQNQVFWAYVVDTES